MKTKSFNVSLKKGDNILLYANTYFHMLGISRATGTVTQVRAQGDGFEFKCNETKRTETIEDGDGEILIRDLLKNT